MYLDSNWRCLFPALYTENRDRYKPCKNVAKGSDSMKRKAVSLMSWVL